MTRISSEIDKLYEYLKKERSFLLEIEHQYSITIDSKFYKLNKFYFKLKEKLFQTENDKNNLINPQILNSLVYDMRIYFFLYLHKKNIKINGSDESTIGNLNLADYFNVYEFFDEFDIEI